MKKTLSLVESIIGCVAIGFAMFAVVVVSQWCEEYRHQQKVRIKRLSEIDTIVEEHVRMRNARH